jgi:Beta-galactosidase
LLTAQRLRPFLASALLLTPLVWTVQGPADRFVPVGVAYAVSPSAGRDNIRRELEAIREAGFNTIATTLAWDDLEPSRGDYRASILDDLLAAADDTGLKVVLRLGTARPPAWVLREFPDGRFEADAMTAGGKGGAARACLDHPGVSAAVQALVRTVSERASRHPAWHAFDLGSDLPSGFCRCRHTAQRYREWGKSNRPDPAAFVRLTLRDHLRLMVAASTARGSRLATSVATVPSVLRWSVVPQSLDRDDWLVASAVDRYGTTVPFLSAAAPPDRLPFGFDGIRSASLEKGWWMRARPAVPEDVRAWGWSALARGARGLIYDDAPGLGGFAHVISRNQTLFGELRPRPAKAAIVYDPGADGSVEQPAGAATAFYTALFHHNIQADLLHVDQLTIETVQRYKLVFLGSSSTLSPAAAAMLKRYAADGGTLVSDATLPGDRIAELATRAGAAPDVRIEGGRGLVETRFIESADVLMLIGLNHAAEPQRVKMTFTLETPEAIWQNMETGSAVNFVAGSDGPVYTYSFRPRDVLVLMIRKNRR